MIFILSFTHILSLSFFLSCYKKLNDFQVLYMSELKFQKKKKSHQAFCINGQIINVFGFVK